MLRFTALATPEKLKLGIPDTFIGTLDGHTMDVGGERWTIEIYAVIVENGRRWLQIGLQGPVLAMIRVSAALDRSPGDILNVLQQLLNENARQRPLNEICGGETLVVD